MPDLARLTGRTDFIRLVVVSLIILLVTLLHYSTMTHKVYHHTLYRDLYFIPILMVSFWYGLRGGLLIGSVVIFLYAPHIAMTWSDQPGVNFGNLMQLFIFALIAVSMGFLSDREKERQTQISRAMNLAILGNASLAMTSELQEVIEQLRVMFSETLSSENQKLHENLKEALEKLTILEETLARFSPGSVERRAETAEINSSIEKVLNQVSKLALDRGVYIESNPDPKKCLVRMKEPDLLWILEQLIRNAIESSPWGQKVVVTSKRLKNQCQIDVTDQGSGIAPENLAKIFVPFYTTKHNGTGLGLAVSRKIIKDNGGEIEVKSRLGEGTTFIVTLPQETFE